MKKKFNIKRKSRKGVVAFKPNRAFLNEAMGAYLENGGKITKIEMDEKAFQSFMAHPENPTAVDDFLRG